jgi:hypothetical protein
MAQNLDITNIRGEVVAPETIQETNIASVEWSLKDITVAADDGSCTVFAYIHKESGLIEVAPLLPEYMQKIRSSGDYLSIHIHFRQRGGNTHPIFVSAEIAKEEELSPDALQHYTRLIEYYRSAYPE